MSEIYILSIEKKLHQAMLMPEPSEAFKKRLWSQMQSHQIHSSSGNRAPLWRRRPAWTVMAILFILLIALFIGFGPKNVSALIRQFLGFGDVGLQSIQEEGLASELEMTAEPTLIPSEPSYAGTPLAAATVDMGETLEGMTVTLEWAYVDELQVALSWNTEPLPADLTYGMAVITYDGFTPLQEQGVIQAQRGENNQLIFMSYQLIQADRVGDAIDFSVDLPLVRQSDASSEIVGYFHFDLQDIPVFRGGTIGLQQTYASDINGFEIRLESVKVMPSSTELVVCYTPASVDAPLWNLENATLQVDNGEETGYHSYNVLAEIEGERCIQLGFETAGADEAGQLVLRVHNLTADVSGETLSGIWRFYIGIPDSAAFNIIEANTPEPTPTAIGSQVQSDVIVTLDWAFVDALRVGVGYTITGLPDVPEAVGVRGHIQLNDEQGNPVGGAGIGTSDVIRVAGEPGVVQGTFSVGFEQPLTQEAAQFELIITLDGSSQMGEYIAGFPVSPEATPYPMGEFPPSLPDHFIGTYTFDFSVPVHPLTVLSDMPPVTVNGIEVRVPRAEVTASMSKVMICYQKPSERDWWIFDAVLSNGVEESRMHGGQVLFDPDVFVYSGYNAEDWGVPSDFQAVEHGRCLLLSFLQGQDDPSGMLTLIIPELEISPPEVIPDAEWQTAMEILNAQGIELVYEIYRGSGGGGGGLNFITLPEGMTEEEAYHKYLEALGYVYAGPWELILINRP